MKYSNTLLMLAVIGFTSLAHTSIEGPKLEKKGSWKLRFTQGMVEQHDKGFLTSNETAAEAMKKVLPDDADEDTKTKIVEQANYLATPQGSGDFEKCKDGFKMASTGLCIAFFDRAKEALASTVVEGIVKARDERRQQ